MAFSSWAWLGRGPAMCEVVWVGVRGGEQFAWAASRGQRGWAWVFWGVCGGLWRVTGWGGRAAGRRAPLGGLLSVGGGEGCPAGGCVAGVCWCSGGWGRPVSRGPGVRAMVGVCESPGEQREGRGLGGDCSTGCVVSVYVSACRGALAWPVVGPAVWRRSLPSSAAAARICNEPACETQSLLSDRLEGTTSDSDRMAVHEIYGSTREMVITWKLMMACNTIPSIVNCDVATADQVQVIQCPSSFGNPDRTPVRPSE